MAAQAATYGNFSRAPGVSLVVWAGTRNLMSRWPRWHERAPVGSVEQLAHPGCCVLAESAHERERVVWWDCDEQR